MRRLFHERSLYGSTSPGGDESFGEFAHGNLIGCLRSEVPCATECIRIFQKAHCQQKITGKGVQDMLPGAGSLRISDDDGFASGQGADAIGNDTILCPVAAADDVSSAGCGKAKMGAKAFLSKVRAAIGGSRQFLPLPCWRCRGHGRPADRFPGSPRPIPCSHNIYRT